MTEQNAFAVSPRYTIEKMRAAGIPDAIAKAKIGRKWWYYDKRRRSEIVFWLNHDECVPLELWHRMDREAQLQFPPHQRPEEPRPEAPRSRASRRASKDL
jgi:hypothetical protein